MSAKLLLDQESDTLLREYRRTGDIGLRNALVLRHMGLVYQIVNRYSALARDAHDDLVQEGCVGLIRAIERFRPDYGVQFSTYAYPVISGTVKNYLRDRRRLLGQSRWERSGPEEAEYAHFGLTPPEGEELLEPDSLEALAGGVEKDFTEQVVDRMVAENLLGRLPSLERRIVQHFFYEDLTQREVARKVSRSTSRISRILRQALERIRALLVDIQKEEAHLIAPEGPKVVAVSSGVVDLETGLFGPQQLGRSLRREVSRARALSAPLTLALVRPNGTSGPPTSAALADVARRIYQQVRVLDHVFRAGASELAMIFSLPPRETSTICQRFQKNGSDSDDLHCVLASYPADAAAAGDLLRVARERLDFA